MRMGKLCMAAFVAALMAGVALAQVDAGGKADPGATDRGTRGDRGGRGARWDPAQMMARVIDRYQERLGATPEEWTALRPFVEKVVTLRQQAEQGGGLGRGMRGADVQEAAVAVKLRELREALDNPNATETEIKTKLAAYLESRAKAREELAKARAELKELLTPKQEATLSVEGLL